MPPKIADTFGESIGMSRRDIRKLARNITSTSEDRLFKENRNIFPMIANRAYLWPKPRWDTDYGEMDSKERAEQLRKDIFVCLVRSAMPPYASKTDRFSHETVPDIDTKAESYVKKMVMTREAALKAVKHSEVNCRFFIENVVPEIWPAKDKRSRNAKVAIAIFRALERLDRISHNALISGFPEWPNKIIFHKNVRLEYLDCANRTGVYFQDGARRMTFQTRDEFQKFIENERGSKKTERVRTSNPARPMLEKLGRTGPEQTFTGIGAEEFMERFALRGGEFGSWLTREDRRQNLEWAASAFSDLAMILGIDEKAIGKNSLGFSFGARGVGGFQAACAHYEPYFNVINLTKWHGAGSLAHEWAHFMDYKILRPAGSGSDAMQWLKGYDNIATGAELMKRRREDLRNAEKAIISAAKNRDYWLGVEIRDKFDSIAGWTEYKDYFRDIARKMLPQNDAEKLLAYMDSHVETTTYYLDCDFYANAKLLDQRRWRPYWSTSHELFARAFEKYIADELAVNGFHNDYLVTLYEHDIPPYPGDDDMAFFTRKIREIVNIILA